MCVCVFVVHLLVGVLVADGAEVFLGRLAHHAVEDLSQVVNVLYLVA